MSGKSAVNRKFSISSLLIAILMTFAVIGTVSIIALSKKYSESALHLLANDIIKRTISDSVEHVSILLEPAVTSVSVLEPQLPADASISDVESDNKQLVTMMIKILQTQHDLYTVYYANEQGEFFLVGKRQRFENDSKLYYFHKRITVRDGKRVVTETWYDDGEKLDTVVLEQDVYNPKARPWYKKAVAEGGAVWTSPYIFFITKLPGITYAKPIYNSGKLEGVLAADLEIGTISRYMMTNVFTKNTSLFASDGSGNILAYSEMFDNFGRTSDMRDTIPTVSNIGSPIMTAMLDDYDSIQANVVRRIRVDGEYYKTIITPVSIYGVNMLLGLYTPSMDYLKPLYDSYEGLAVIGLIMLVLTVAISRYISRQLARPFEMLSEATERAKDLQFDKQININSNFKEVINTQNNFNKMLENLENYQSANQLLSDTLHNAHIDTLYRLAMAAEHKDQYTYDHIKRVSDISVLVADVLGMSKHDMELIRHASAMHDVGKLGIPDHILMKPGKLTRDEFEVIKTHSELGAKILENPSSEEMKASMVVARSHHEKWNGSGYPNKLSGASIPLYGRIVSLADVIDALLSKRPYKEPYSFEKTIEIVRSEKGEHFDPELTDLILENVDHLKKIII